MKASGGLGTRESRPQQRAPGAANQGPPAGAKEQFLPVFLVAVTLLAYQPVWHAGFVWDDDYYVTQNPTLRDLKGLWRIWFQVGATPQYYPLVHSVFWLQYHAWGLQPLGYHIVNVLLHALAAILFARVLLRLRVPGAWLAAFLFALHPVGVESVAWVTELKNVLSAVFYFAAALAYLRFVELQEGSSVQRHLWGWYAGALVLFTAALLSKTVTCSLPAALLLVRWWRTGRLRAADLVPVAPFFLLGAGLALQTAWIEQHFVGAQGAQWSLSLAQRCLVAGRAVWFYAGKLLWPVDLSFIYPRWNVNPAVWWQWAFPVGALGLVLWLWWVRARVGRGPLTAVLFFTGTLGPALGFINVYPMRYSFVADHFQYLASVGLLTLAAAGLGRLGASKRIGPSRERALSGALLLVLAGLTWRQTHAYANLETLWRRTIAVNPGCSIAHNNLGNVLLSKGQMDEAFIHFQKAVEVAPDNAEAYDSLGFVLLQRGQVDQAIVQFQKALDIHPHALAYHNLGTALLRKGQPDAAMEQFEKALERQPGYAAAHNSLGLVLLTKGQPGAAVGHFQAALKLEPDDASVPNNLGTALLRNGQLGEAIDQYRRALMIRPDFPEAYDNLRYVAWLLATYPEASVRNGPLAVELAQQADRLSGGRNPLFIAAVAAAQAEAGRFADAIAAAQRALQLATAQDNTALADALRSQISLYQTGNPYREVPR
jgi:tetratricopeptide (TPR) repeat protein